MRSPNSALLLLGISLSFATLASGQVSQTSSVQKRDYFFEEASKKIEYTLFVPRSYDKSIKSPLVVLLHGLGSNPQQVIRYKGIREEAQKRGYIVVAPYGYNSRGWYGSRGKGKEGPYFGRKDDPANLGELSEKDVMNVLGIARKEFNVDERRIYLMGHSMGGGGTIYLGGKYPEIWAGLAALSPAVHGKVSMLDKLKRIPVMIVSGDKDRLVPVKDVRRWVGEMEKRGIEHVYNEIKEGNHYFTITHNPEMMAGVFDFFDKHKRDSGAREKNAASGD